MKYEFTCEHDKGVLKLEKTNSGSIYTCPKCGCVYRLMIARNDNKCWAKRFPVKK
jgi:predicted RNA-binding Zn-ribbon protein involved in translation (DUF1610 family)